MNNVWQPDEIMTGWMEGRVHELPPIWRHNLGYYRMGLRWRNFVKACRRGDPSIILWPEFQKELNVLHLSLAYKKGTISVAVAGLLIAQSNSSVGKWLERAGRMERAGKDPLRRRRYLKAMRQLYVLIAQARRLAEQRQFEQVAYRAMLA